MENGIDFSTEMYLAELDLDLPFELRNSQKEALAHIMNDKGVLVVIPTSGGKTIISVMASKHAKLKGMKSLLLAPLRALTSEHIDTYKEYGLNPMIDNGEHPKSLSDYRNESFDVVISTYEKMDSIIRMFDPNCESEQKRDYIFGMFDTIIIDEAHSIEDDERGVNIESLIMSIRFLYPDIKIVALSATIGNKEDFAEWLGVPLVFQPSNERPVPLDIKYIQLESYGFTRQYAEKMSYLRPAVLKNMASHDKTMIAVTSVGRTKQIVYNLMGYNESEKPNIAYCMNTHRIAWHYSGSRGMTENERMAVEWAFDYDSIPDNDEYFYEGENVYINRKDWLELHFGLTHGIDTIVCTPTLIVGRNLPVTYIEVFDHIQYTFKSGPQMIGSSRLQQTIGRAGRLKFAYKNGKLDPNYKGVARIYIPSDDYSTIKNRAEVPFDVESKLKHRLGEKILAWINSNIVKTEDDIYKFLSYAFDREISDNKELIKKKINFLIKFRFVERGIDNVFRITEKGLITIRFYIQPETVVAWGKIVKSYHDATKVNMEELIARSMDVDEFCSNVIVTYKENQILSNMRSVLKCDSISNEAVKSFIFTFPDYSRTKLDITENDYIIPDSESASIRSQFERMISAMHDIYRKSRIGRFLNISRFMVKSGIFNTSLADLMSVEGITASYAKRLMSHNINSRKDLIDLNNTNKRRLLSILGIGVGKWNVIEQRITDD